jgi:hypothetical protein
MSDFDQFEYEERKEKVQTGSYNEGIKLIYQWVKQEVIGLREFRLLLDDNRESVY